MATAVIPAIERSTEAKSSSPEAQPEVEIEYLESASTLTARARAARETEREALLVKQAANPESTGTPVNPLSNPKRRWKFTVIAAVGLSLLVGIRICLMDFYYQPHEPNDPRVILYMINYMMIFCMAFIVFYALYLAILCVFKPCYRVRRPGQSPEDVEAEFQRDALVYGATPPIP